MAHRWEGAVIDWTECDLVESNPRKLSGTPILKDSRMPADAIVQNYVGGSPVEEIAENFDIPEAAIREVLRYAAERQAAPRS